jgi:hypothetical protein
MARRFRVPFEKEHGIARLKAMAGGDDSTVDVLASQDASRAT